MNKALLILLLLTFAGIHPLVSQNRPKATLEITFTGMRNGKGMVATGVNRSPEGWPREPHLSPKWKKTGIDKGSMTVKLENLEYGSYAMSVLDDENSNLEMDMFLGIPKEGFGFSMNPKTKMKAPRFEECVFEIDKPYKRITIELKYIGKG